MSCPEWRGSQELYIKGKELIGKTILYSAHFCYGSCRSGLKQRLSMGWECVHHIFGCDKQRITASEVAKPVSSRVIIPHTHLRTCLQNTRWTPNHVFSIQNFQETNIDSPSFTLNLQTCIYNWFLKNNTNKLKGLKPGFQLSPDTAAGMGTHQTALFLWGSWQHPPHLCMTI